MPTRQPVAEAQYLRATARVPIGAPRLTDTALVTWDKIVETVFLALLATTFGTLLAIPISFIAARNLMSDVKYSLTSVALTIIGWPLGIVLGVLISGWLGTQSEWISANRMLNVGGLIFTPVLVFILMRWGMPQAERAPQGLAVRFSRILVYLLIAASSIFFLQLLAKSALSTGRHLDI